MCFIINGEKNKPPKVSIAKKDIVCYKNISGDGYPEHRALRIGRYAVSEPYKTGWIYKEDIKIILEWKNGRWEGNRGFHSFTNKKEAIRSTSLWCDTHVFRIPKGSRYWKSNGYYFSDKIQRIS